MAWEPSPGPSARGNCTKRLKTTAGLLPLKALAIEARFVGLVAPASHCGPASSAEALAPQVQPNVPLNSQSVPRGSGWHPLCTPKAMLQAHCRGAEAAMMDRVVRLARWLRSQIVQVVPQHMAVCEFECQETTCTSANWQECRRRREMTPGGADPRRRSGDDSGLTLGDRRAQATLEALESQLDPAGAWSEAGKRSGAHRGIPRVFKGEPSGRNRPPCGW
jgi:hypothetical protein